MSFSIIKLVVCPGCDADNKQSTRLQKGKTCSRSKVLVANQVSSDKLVHLWVCAARREKKEDTLELTFEDKWMD
jgi:hypothetical protein